MGETAALKADTVRNTLRNVRNILEPVLLFHEFWPYTGIQAQEFRARVLNWRRDTLDSTLYGLATLGDLGEGKEWLERDVEVFISALKRNLVSQNGYRGFQQCEGAQATVYASSMAIGMLRRTIKDLPRDKPLGYNQAVRMLGKAEVHAIVDFVLASQDKTGGFFDLPEAGFRQKASLCTTHSAYLLLWNLEKLDASLISKILGFLHQCEKAVDLSTAPGAGGFAQNPDSEVRTYSTYFALNLLKRMGEDGWVERVKPKVTEFFEEACWIETGDVGGFRSSHRHPRTLDSTCHAVRILLDVFKDPEFLRRDARYQKVLNYMKACQSEDGGFKFQHYPALVPGSELRWFSPNLYMTFQVVRTSKLLQDYFPDAQEVFGKEQVVQFINEASKMGEKLIYPGYVSKDVGRMGERIVELTRSTTDFLFMPGNPQRYPALTMTPTLYYLVILIGLPFFLGLLVLFTLVSRQSILILLALMAGPVGVLVTAALEASLWLLRRR